MKIRYLILLSLVVLLFGLIIISRQYIISNIESEKVLLLSDILNDVDEECIVDAVSHNSKKVEDEEILALLSPKSNNKPIGVYTKGSFVIYLYGAGHPRVKIERLEFR